ncbi:MAG: macro domain-containing protein [Armatimonadota bacterium]|nr:macro domain-containing protein [Armatimonadota bacterium]
MERYIGTTLIKVERADLTTLEVDAIVNAANTRLLMGGGVAGAIKRRGGAEIEREAVALGPIPVGEAVVTGAGKLPAKYVIHAATMAMDFQTDAGKIRLATRNSLLRAEERQLRSVAFPALGTGVGGFPLQEAARVMLEEIRDHLRKGSRLETIIIAVLSDEAYRAFASELEGLSG